MPFIIHDIFGEVVILLLIAAVIGALALKLRQPLVLGFIAVGILVGPSGLGWLKSTNQIHLWAEMGLSLLLFVIGLRLDLQLIRTMGPVAILAGLGQVLATTLAGFAVALALGMPATTALYIGLALSFSSTIIVVKLLSDKHETESLHGRLCLGILIMQDLVAVLAMIGLSAANGDTAQFPLLQLAYLLLKGFGVLAVVWLMTFIVLPRLLPMLARSTELLVLFAIAWALLLAFASDMLGFGKEVGAFLAGVSLASTHVREILGAKLSSLRDFLLLFFFIELGSGLEISALGNQLIVSLVLALFVFIVKPLVVTAVLGGMGYRKRTSFMTGIHLAQISEFSLILVTMARVSGHVSEAAVGMITLVGLLTIGISSQFIQHARRLYEWCRPYLGIFERKTRHREDRAQAQAEQGESVDIILYGLGGYGTGIAEHLRAHGRGVLGVDADPQMIDAWQARGWPAIFGDAEDPDFAASLPLGKAKWVVSAIAEPQINLALARAVRHAGYRGNIAFTTRDRAEGESLLQQETGLLFVPFEDAAVQAVDLLIATEAQIARETMDKIIAQMHDHFVVCGYGRMGQQIVKDFVRQGVSFVVVEDNPDQLPRLREQQIPHVVGEAIYDEILIQAGIARAKGLIAVAASDEENVFIVLTARGLNPDLYIVARSIREENEDKLRRAGADRVMSPYILGGRRMSAAVTKPGVMDFLDLVVHSDTFNTEIGNITILEQAHCINRSLEELGIWQQCGVTVLAVQRRDEGFHASPCPSFVLQGGDEVFIMGTMEQIESTKQFLLGASDAETVSLT